MPKKTVLYICEVCREVNDPLVYVARLVSRTAELGSIAGIATGKTPDAADAALRALLKEHLAREAFPINVHILPDSYFCLPCSLFLPTRASAIEHRRSKHGAVSTLP